MRTPIDYNGNISTTVCFTGHRPSKLEGGYNHRSPKNKLMLKELQGIIIDLIENHSIDTFISGMALGIDLWSALMVIKLKEKYPHIKLICAIPHKNQTKIWADEQDRDTHSLILDVADDVIYVSTDEYTVWSLHKRNEFMVDNADIIIAVWDGTKGGTANCVKYAKKNNKNIFRLDPKTLELNKEII